MYGLPVGSLYGHCSGLRGTLKARGIHWSVLRLQEWTRWVPGIGKLTSLSYKQGYWLVLWEDMVSDTVRLPWVFSESILSTLCGFIFMFCLSTTPPQKPQPLIL